MLIYKKLHSVNLSSINQISTGMVINVVTSDLNQLMGGVLVPNGVIIPLVVIFTLGYLWVLFSYFSLFFLLAIIINMKVSVASANGMKNSLQGKIKASDTRTKIMT